MKTESKVFDRLFGKDSPANMLKTVTCFWCKKDFEPTSHNKVHLGGRYGDVYGCNYCLQLKETP